MTEKKLPPIEDVPPYRPGVGRYCKTCAMKYGDQPEVEDYLAARRRRASGSRGVNLQNRIQSLQQNIRFLQRQHKDTLHRLHLEVDKLKRENNELHYKRIMEGGKKKVASKHCQTSEEDGIESLSCQTVPYQCLRARYLEATATCKFDPFADLKGRLITSLQPLRIQTNPSYPPRPATLQDCEVIIRQLYNANCLQFQEINHAKKLLQNIIDTKKITAENLTRTQAYLNEEIPNSVQDSPKPTVRFQLFPDKKSGESKPAFILPSLKHSFNPNIAERQRKTRAMQKERLAKLRK